MGLGFSAPGGIVHQGGVQGVWVRRIYETHSFPQGAGGRMRQLEFWCMA